MGRQEFWNETKVDLTQRARNRDLQIVQASD